MGLFNDTFSTEALFGAGAGFLVGGPAGAAIGFGLGGAAGAGDDAAKAAGRAAELQNQQAQAQLAFDKQTRDQAVAASFPSLEEIAAINGLNETRAITLQRQAGALQKDRELLDAVDPALKEAGVQALQLLQGKDAKILDPLRRNRSKARARLEESLAQRLGGGFRTSSAGIEALNSFDDSTDNILAQSQQQALGSLLSLSAQVRPDLVSKINQSASILGQLDQTAITAQQNIAGRKVNAITGSPVNFQNVIQTAGASEVGNIAQAENLGQLFGTVGNIGAQVGLAGLKGATGGPAAAVPTTRASTTNTFGDLFGSGKIT